MKYETKYIKPLEVINEKELNKKDFGSLYDAAASVITKFCELNKMYDDVIIGIKVRTPLVIYNEDITYKSTEYASFNGNDCIWEFHNDFDEGERYITVTDICYVHEIFEG